METEFVAGKLEIPTRLTPFDQIIGYLVPYFMYDKFRSKVLLTLNELFQSQIYGPCQFLLGDSYMEILL